MSKTQHPADTGTLPPHVIDRALREASHSSCKKSKRGCAIFIQRKSGAIVIAGMGHNDPPPGDRCDGSKACRETCRKRCVHAELDAVLDMLNLRMLNLRVIAPYDSLPELVHVELNDKEHLVAGGPPSCWPCANLIVHAGIHAVWLYENMWEGPRWTRWTATTFLHSTLKRQPDHPDYEPRNAIEEPCGRAKRHDGEGVQGCGATDGAKRDAKGFWRCIRCGWPSP
jgi:deoxycytidylate deaminase